MKVRTILILIFTQIFLQVCGQDNLFKQYGPADGLDNSFLYSINQDNDGYLWLGTAEGLFRFNGFKFQHFTEKDSLAENFISKIYKDSPGGLWVGHRSGGITHLSDDRFSILSEFSTNNSSVTSITETDAGTIWFSTKDDELLVLYPDKRLVKLSTPVENELIISFMHISGNLFLLGTQENLYLMKYSDDSGSFEEKIRISNYPSSSVVDIIKDGIGGFIISSRDEGIFKLTIDAESLIYELEEISNNTNEDLDNIQGALFVNVHELWVYTMGNGIIKFNRDCDSCKFSTSGNINTKNGLISNNVQCMFKDMEGNIWLGMYGDGLLRLVDDNLKFYSFQNTIGTNLIYSLSADSNNIWISSENSISNFSPEDGKVRKTYTFPVRLKGARTNSIYCSNKGLIYIGFEKAGVFTFDPQSEKYSKLFLSLDDLENSVNHITGKGNNVWISTKKGACKLNTLTGDKNWFSTDDGLPHNNIQHLFIDSNDRIFFGTISNSIYYLDRNEKLTVLPSSASMGINSVISFAEDNKGCIWAATMGNGVFMFCEEGILNYTQTSGILSDYCYSLIFDGAQNILVSHKGGFSRIDTESTRIKHYTQTEGINISSDFYPNAVLVDQFKNTWFGTSEGLVKYMPQITGKALTPVSLHIDAVYFNKQEINFNENIKVKSGFYQIEIEYIGISLYNPIMVSYQTFLEGYSPDWSELTNERRVMYEKVGHGDYTLRVRGFNENGLPLENPINLSIKINKPFYLTWWFILLSISLVFLIITVYIRLREQNLKKEKIILAKKVRERTREVMQKSQIIEEKNRDITASIQYAERIQRAMLPETNSIKDTFVLFIPKDIVSGDFYWIYDNSEISYLAAVDCTGHGVPGAFMSIIGNNSLNKVVKEYGITKPSAILDRLNKEVNREILQCSEVGIKDGMDISLIAINKKNFTMEFAGAMNPLYIIRDGDLMIYKGDRFAIDMLSLGQKKEFTNNKIDIQPGDMIYLFSDGYADQFGSVNDKKFKSSNVKRVLSEVWNLPVEEQKVRLEKEIMEWKGDLPQVDDILFIGLRVPS